MIKFKMLPDGGFAAGDTETGNAAYAYPTSPNATRAKRQPHRVAAEMVKRANDFAPHCSPALLRDCNARHWARIECDAPGSECRDRVVRFPTRS